MQVPPPLSQAATHASTEPTCDDCYFRRRDLCALDLESPCRVFRPAGDTLQPLRQAPPIPLRVLVPVGAAA